MAEVATVTPKHLLHEGTPAQIRGAIVPEDREAFDREFAEALDAVRSTLSLDALDRLLKYWRPRAAHQQKMGHDRWHEIMALGDYVEKHGDLPPGMRANTHTIDEHKALIRRRLAELGVSE